MGFVKKEVNEHVASFDSKYESLSKATRKGGKGFYGLCRKNY